MYVMPLFNSFYHFVFQVIVVKSIGDKNVLELLDVDDSEIQIDDLPKKEPSMEEMMMLRRMEQPGLRGDILLPKDSAGEAMISGEASDDDEEHDNEDCVIDSDIESSLADSYFSDKDSEQELDPCEFIIGKDIKLDNDDLKTRRRMTSSARHNRRLNKDTCRMNMELSWSEDGEGGFQTEE